MTNCNHIVDLDEIIRYIDIKYVKFCNLVLNCISSRYIKGYLNLKKRVLVLSKNDPFNLLTTN